MIATRPSSDTPTSVETRWTADQLFARLDGVDVHVSRQQDETGARDDEATIAELYSKLQDKGWQPRGCADCIFFRSTSLAQQFSGRRAGYCALAGFRKRFAIVSIDHYCGEHEPVTTWPDDQQLATQQRIERSNKAPYPSRRSAILAAIVGFVVVETLAYEKLPDTRHNLERHLTKLNDQPNPFATDRSLLLAAIERIIQQHDVDPTKLAKLVTEAFTGDSQLSPCDDSNDPWFLAVSASVGLALGLRFWSQPRTIERWQAQQSADGLSTKPIGSTTSLDIAQWMSMAMQKRTCDQMQSTLHAAEDARPNTAESEATVIAQSLSSFCHAPYQIVSAVSDAILFDSEPSDANDMLQPTILTKRLRSALVASIGGAYNGLPNLPTTWSASISRWPEMMKLAEQLDNLTREP